MADPDADVQNCFDDLPYKVKRQLAAAIKEQADGLAEAIKAAAPVRSGRLGNSRPRSAGKRTISISRLLPAAMTPPRRWGTVRASITITRSRLSTAPPKGMPKLFFYPTFHAREDDIRQVIEDAANDVVAKV